MKVTMVGHTATSDVKHAVHGEWTYSGTNMSWCGTRLTGCEYRDLSTVEVTCNRCVKVVPEYPQEFRDLAHAIIVAWRWNQDKSPSDLMNRRELLSHFPKWSGTVVDLAKIVLSGSRGE